MSTFTLWTYLDTNYVRVVSSDLDTELSTVEPAGKHTNHLTIWLDLQNTSVDTIGYKRLSIIHKIFEYVSQL